MNKAGESGVFEEETLEQNGNDSVALNMGNGEEVIKQRDDDEVSVVFDYFVGFHD